MDIAEIVSLGLTPQTIFMSLMVVVRWGPAAFRAYTTPRLLRTESQWFILGVTYSFSGASVDNFYWGIAWTNHFLGTPTTRFWFETGALSNIPFRQVAGIFAAWCHLRAASVAGDNQLKFAIYASNLAGIAYAICLIMIRG